MTPAKHEAQMGKSISVANAKGGVGKTTLALTVAGALAAAGQRVQLVDLDDQGSSLTWSGIRAGKGRAQVFDVTATPAAGYDWTVYDHPPGLPQKVNTHAHVVLVPTVLSMQDYTATSRFIQELQKSGSRFLVLPNRVELISSDQSSMLAQLFKDQAYMPKRSGLQRAFNDGVTVYDERPGVPNSTSIRKEFDVVMAALIGLLNDPSRQRVYDEDGNPIATSR
ncbi:ParA family protein [Stenotrophomonas maltophilia]|uniref:ParA family protein n=1 Tax=Stenotrophomonas maltophilia TaxID=40324 RepID=UPI0013DBA5EC|nr:ParA family protein [Stenotrophomonas maltophilia]MDG2510939.1 ParA family protein [Stenotrophomonas maltophilia]